MASSGPLVLGRYVLEAPIASGGMATIYIGRQAGALGFSRVVAIKRLHPQFASEPDFMAMFVDEARLAARVRHPNVVETLDVVREGAETFIVLEYVDGESLSGLMAALRADGGQMPPEVAVAIVSGMCRGLQAAHEARGPDGAPLGIVHRDVSPQNVLVGADGRARVVDFGVALANVRLSQTRAGQVKGKLAYMAPEQLSHDEVTRATDIYAAGVVLWELCAGRRAYDTTSEGALVARVLAGSIPRLDQVAPWAPPALANAVHRALCREPSQRYASAREMADAIERVLSPATPAAVGAFVERWAASSLLARRQAAAKLDLGAAGAAAGLAGPAPAGAPGAPAPPLAPHSVRPVGLPAPDARERATHTLTSPGPMRRRIPPMVLAALGAAIVIGASAGAAALVILRAPAEPAPRAAEPAGPEPTAPEPTAPDPAPTSAHSGAPEAEPPEPRALQGEPSAPATAPPERGRQRTAEPPRTGSARKPCDPPYYVDEEGIRRVKRECF